MLNSRSQERKQWGGDRDSPLTHPPSWTLRGRVWKHRNTSKHASTRATGRESIYYWLCAITSGLEAHAVGRNINARAESLLARFAVVDVGLEGGSRSYCWPPEPPRRLPFKIPNHFFLFFEKQQEPKSAKTLLSARLPTLARGSRWTIKTQLQKKKNNNRFTPVLCGSLSPQNAVFIQKKKKPFRIQHHVCCAVGSCFVDSRKFELLSSQFVS